MKHKNLFKTLLTYLPIIFLLSGCLSLSLVSPSFNYNNNYSGANPNQITCDVGGFFSYPECSIPISRFVALTVQYADPLESGAILTYAQKNNNAFIFDDIEKTATLESLNQQVFTQLDYNSLKFIHLPDSVQNLLIKQKNHYMPHDNYKKQVATYIYLYTLNAMHFAITPCEPFIPGTESMIDQKHEQQFMIYKVFSIQYTNNILRHIGNSYFHFNTTYENEDDLYEHLYANISKLDANQLLTLAKSIYQQTVAVAPQFESSFNTTGITFGTLGDFYCRRDSTGWQKYGSDYFGINVSGVKLLVNFKNRDVFTNTEKTNFKIINNN